MKNDILNRPWKELKQIRDEKLRYFITRHLYPFSPYYRKLFDDNKIKPESIKTVKDLSSIPLTSKKDFFCTGSEDPGKRNRDFILQPNEELIKKYLPKSELIKVGLTKLLRGKEYLKNRLLKEYKPLFLTATTGTTKEPVSFLYTAYDIENLKLYGKRVMDIFGVSQEMKGLNVFPYAPHLAFWQTVFAGFASGIFVLSTGGGKTLGTEGNVRLLLKVKPEFMIGVPGYVYHILKTAREQNLDLSFLKSIVLGASRVPRGFKKKISVLLAEMGSSDIKVFGTYGFTESRCAWGECPTDISVSSGYHTYPDREVFEIIDPDTGEVKGEGEDGEIVYTGIDNRGSCVLRYRTGDLAKGGISYEPCPHCGRTVPRISSDITRASNKKNIMFSKVKGSLVNLNNLAHLLDDKQEVDEWQIEITKKNDDPCEVDEMNLYISFVKDINAEDFKNRLNEEAFASVDVSFNNVNIISREEILSRLEVATQNKAKKIVDKRPN